MTGSSGLTQNLLVGLVLAAGALGACVIPSDPPGNVSGQEDAGSGSGNGTSGGATSGGTSGGTGGDSADGGGSSGNTADPGGGTQSDGGSTNSNSQDSGTSNACIKPVTANGDGHHNAGKDCLSCHSLNNGSGAPHWFVAGTLYDSTGTTPVSGATIAVVDAMGQALSLATATNGNFWTSTSVTFPLTVRASRCPSDQTMPTAAKSGTCNKSSCHDSSMPLTLQ